MYKNLVRISSTLLVVYGIYMLYGQFQIVAKTEVEHYQHTLFEIVDLKKDALIEITLERPGIPGLHVKNIPRKRCPGWREIELGSEWYLTTSTDLSKIDITPICLIAKND